MKRATSFDEAGAVDTIVRWITPLRDQMAEQITTEASRLELCQAVYEAIRTGARTLEQAIEAAREGDPYAERALREIASELLANNGPLPEILRLWASVALLTDATSFPQGQHGLNARNKNAAIKALVEGAMERWGLLPSRNRATDTQSASSLVSTALQRCGFDFSEGQVQRAYEAAIKPAMP